MFGLSPFDIQMMQMQKMMSRIKQITGKMDVIARALNVDNDPAFNQQETIGPLVTESRVQQAQQEVNPIEPSFD